MTLHLAVTLGFISAAAVNIVGMLQVSRGFTRWGFFEADPELFSRSGTALILVWGLAYLSVAPVWHTVPWLCGVFALEKAFFALSWWRWHRTQARKLAGLDPDTARFMRVYGLIDGAYMIFFATACLLGLTGRVL